MDYESSRDLVETILAQASADDKVENSRVLESLLAVRSRHLGERIEFDLIAAELVSAALSACYGPDRSAGFAALSKTVAQTLCDDQVSRTRLEALWDQLGRTTGET
jgi:hypothetical protein